MYWITGGYYVQRPFNDELVREFHRDIIGEVLPDSVGHGTRRFVDYQTASAHYDNHHLNPLIEFWYERLADPSDG